MQKLATCFLLCAWIIWQQYYLEGRRVNSEMLEAFGRESVCKDAIEGLLQRQQNAGREVVGYTVKGRGKGKVDTVLICLPDTVKLQ